ncbi:transcriptional regulator [Frankia sp. BMG5.23]|nr:transcriptional regulator [Frankia sp. BMG5.23]
MSGSGGLVARTRSRGPDECTAEGAHDRAQDRTNSAGSPQAAGSAEPAEPAEHSAAPRAAAARGPAAPRGRGVLEGAFDILDALSWFDSVGLSELARTAGLPKTTVHRLVEQMCALGVVDRDSGGYRIGSGLRRLAAPDRSLHRLARIARDPVASLSAATRTAIALVVLRERRLVLATSAAGDRGIDLRGSTSSLRLDTAAGQMLLACQPELVPPPSMSEREWKRARAVIRREEAAFDQQDLVDGICCVSVPVRSRDGVVVAALTALVVAQRIPAGLVGRIRHAAGRLGGRLTGPLEGRPLPCGATDDKRARGRLVLVEDRSDVPGGQGPGVA